MRVRLALGVAAVSIVTGCAAPALDEGDEPIGKSSEPLTAVCQANVKGVGLVDTEDKYLPNVIHCENGGAPFESLKAQAIAARSYLYYKMETSGSIADGTGDQVYSCGSGPTAEQIKAVKDTAGMVLRYKDVTVCAFYVAGGAGTPPACKGDPGASTEKYVTYNEGKSGSGITQTSLGFVSPTNYRNRGCFSQLGSRCLDKAGKKAEEILRFYYGSDIGIETATGPCVPPPTPMDAGTPPIDASAPKDASTPKDTSVADTAVADASFDAGTPIVDDAGASPDTAPRADTRPFDDSEVAKVTGSCGCTHAGARSSPDLVAVSALAIGLAFVRRRR